MLIWLQEQACLFLYVSTVLAEKQQSIRTGPVLSTDNHVSVIDRQCLFASQQGEPWFHTELSNIFHCKILKSASVSLC